MVLLWVWFPSRTYSLTWVAEQVFYPGELSAIKAFHENVTLCHAHCIILIAQFYTKHKTREDLMKSVKNAQNLTFFDSRCDACGPLLLFWIFIFLFAFAYQLVCVQLCRAELNLPPLSTILCLHLVLGSIISSFFGKGRVLMARKYKIINVWFDLRRGGYSR